MRLAGRRALEDGRCVAECAGGRFRSGGRCHLCDHTCSTCVDAGATNCTSCHTGEDWEPAEHASVPFRRSKNDNTNLKRLPLMVLLPQISSGWSATCTGASACTPVQRPSTTRQRGGASAAPTTAACAAAPAAASAVTPPTTSLTARAPNWSAGKVTQVDPVLVSHGWRRLEAFTPLFSCHFFLHRSLRRGGGPRLRRLHGLRGGLQDVHPV